MTDLRQLHFRFRTDAGTADATPTWGAGEDINYYPGTANFRLRIGLRNASTVVAATPWELYVSRNGDAYTPVTTTIAKGVQSVDAGASADDTQVLIPRLYPFTTDWILSGAAIDLDFAGSRVYPGASFTDYLSISRASTGYATTAAGTLTSFATNTLRITDLGLLVEDARTNYQLDSEVFSNWVAQVTGATVTSNTTVAPDGNTTGDTIAFAAVNDYRYHQVVAGADGTYTFSIYLQGTPGDKIALRMVGSSSYYTLVTLTASWVRYSVSGSLVTPVGVQCGLDNRTIIDAGLTNACTLKAWGGQLELGAFGSSYISTTTTAATRAADSITTLASLDTLLRASARTSVIDLNATAAPVGFKIILGADVNQDIYSANSNTIVTFQDGATNKDFSGSGTYTGGVKVGAAVNGSAFSITGAGLSPSVGSTGAAMSGTNVYLGSQGSLYWFGYFRRATFWNSRLSDGTLQSLTSP